MDIQTEQKKPVANRWMAVAFDWVGAMVAALAVLMIVLTQFFRIVGVVGSSMQPTLHNNERLILSITTEEYHRGDVIVIDRYTEEPLIKRVIAVGGDTVSIQQGMVKVNGKQLNETYTQGITQYYSDEVQEVPAGHYFVLGDNRSDSKDSRDKSIGMVSGKDIVGKVLLRIWPFEKVGLIESK